MKILIAASYYPPAIGGLERYAAEMAKVAQKANYEVVVICSGETKAITKEVSAGVSIYRIPTAFKLLNTPINLRWYRMIKDILVDEAPDIINVHMPVPYLSDLVILASKRIPSIVTYHSGSMKKRNFVADKLIDIYERFLLPIVLRKADRVICSSEFVRHTFLKKYLSKSVSISPGVDISEFTRRSVDPIDNKVIFIGNFSYGWKGLEYLIDAIKILPLTHLVVVGHGDPVESPRTVFLGMLRGRELVREIQSSKILVLPSVSNSESFGMVLIEAMACGVPVIGSNVGGIPDTIRDQEDGLLVEPRSVGSLAAAITQIIDDPLLATRLSEAAYEKVVNHYTWQVQGAKYLEVLDEVMERS